MLSSDVVELQGLCDRVARVLARPGGAHARGRGDHRGEHHRRRDHVRHPALGASWPPRGDGAPAWRRFGAGDYLPTRVLLLLIAGPRRSTRRPSNGRFFLRSSTSSACCCSRARSCSSALGQLIVMLTGGIDLSVGPLAGLVVVVLSFFAAAGQSGGRLLLGILAVIGTALAVGLTNAVLVRIVRLSRRCSRRSRPTSSSRASRCSCARRRRASTGPGVTSAIKTTIGWVPVAFIVVAAVALVCECCCAGRATGSRCARSGSDATRAHRLGARVNADAGLRLRAVLAVHRRGRASCSPRRSPSAIRRSASTTRSRASPRSCSAARASSAAGAPSSARSAARC